MRVMIRYFQATKCWAGTASEELELPEGATVLNIADVISARHAMLAEARESLMFAVNAEHAASDRELADGDEVAVMPPFSGG